ncbi:WD40 repeat-like protein [Rhizopogon salebrosus TDB-379]|nr:WD40 repeat-like protein [Rhizopogon salebrosus TDB-379]
MLRDKAKSGGSTKQGKVMGVALVDSPTRVAPLTSVKDPPPYGAQHRQDALWEGGNEALPPRWQQFEMGDSERRYQDDNLVMVSWNQPLPGVRLGRSYFVNHNTRTTSWKKPVPDRPAGSLTPESVIEGHSECIWNLTCVGTDCNIMSASSDGSIRQWIRDGEPVGEPWRSDGGVTSMAVCPDQRKVVSGSVDGRLRLWNVKEGSMVRDPWEGHSAAVRCLDWSPNAREITSGSEDGTIRRWNPITGRQIAPPIETGHGRVYAVKYSPRGDKFASCGSDRVIRVWSKDGDMAIRKWQSIDGKELVVLRGHTSIVTSICLSPDERHLVSASSDYSVRIWHLKTNQQVGDPLLHDDQLLAIAIPSDGQYIASAGLDKNIYVWSFEAALKQNGNQADGKLKIFDGSPLPKRQANNEGSTRYWIRDGEPVGEPWRSDGGVTSMAVCPDQRKVVSGSVDGRLRLWNVKEGSVVRDPWEGHSAAVRCLDWSPNAREITSGSEDGTIRRWNPITGRQIAPPIETGHGRVYAVKYSPRGDKFASCGSDRVIRVWSKDGKLLIEIKGHVNSVWSLCWSKNGTYIFSGSGDMAIRKWQSIDGKELVVLRGHTSIVTSICLSPDERHLVSASSDYSVRIWHLKTNQQVGDPLLHDDQLLAIAIPSDGQYIASAGLDKNIYVWSFEAALKQNGNQADGKLKGHASSSKDIFDGSPLPKRQANNEGSTRYGNDFWGGGTKSTPRRLPPHRGPSPPRRRNFLYFRRSVDASPSMPLQAQRWNFSLFSGRIPAHTVDVAPARDEDRYAIAPATEAEKAAAMQYAIGNEVNGSSHQGGAAAGVQGPQEGPPIQTVQGQNLAAPTEESSDLIGCCGFVLVRRSRSH